MAVRWDIDSAREFVGNNSDCKLLSTEYKNSKIKLKFLCRCGNEFETSFNAFLSKNKRQCNQCTYNKMSETTRLSYEEVKYFIEFSSDSGCELLSKEYVNNISKLKIKCKCGNIFSVTLNDFKNKNKRQCNDCGMQNISNSLMLNYHEVKKYIEEEYIDVLKLTLLSEDYTGAYDEIIVMDSDGYKYNTKLANLKSNYKRRSILERFSIANKYSIDNINIWLKLNDNDNILLSKQLMNSREKLLWKCKNGHEFESILGTVMNGYGCPVCAGQSKPSIDFVRYEFEKRNYTLISKKYKNRISKLIYICNAHRDVGTQEITWGSFNTNGSGCRY